MAGMVRTQPRGPAPAGHVWDAAKGGYISQSAQQRNQDAEQLRRVTPLERVSATGDVYQTMPGSSHVTVRSPSGGAFDALGSVARGSRASGGGAADEAADPRFLAKIDELWNMPPATVNPPPTFTAPPTPELGLELTPAERAHFGAAKVRSGQRLRSGLKDLDAAMNSRGLTGNRIHSGAMSALMGQALGEMEDTERGVLSTRQNRVRELENMGYAGATHAANQNFGGQQEYNQQALQAQLAQRQQLHSLLSLYGMAY